MNRIYFICASCSVAGLKEAKESENTQQPRERHSSWLGRSLRKISSSSKTTSEEPLEKTEKPKRERRRSLLWRLGRDSKSELAESVAEDSGAPDGIVVAKSNEGKEDRKGGRKEERKGEKKEEKKEDKKEDKGIANYLRRSSRRKKSQVCKLFYVHSLFCDGYLRVLNSVVESLRVVG